ncbi:hypothetical protein DPMN_148847 [Dreissena polymorpha]|uniref:Uncharacterized protein n=1 Tax=Dreissena polymorpha TaxID=45954 RepID=A0A9D4FBN9_DREPO|nr:hypothetical protein DPMN_148847 [Dreissena polymorpha]
MRLDEAIDDEGAARLTSSEDDTVDDPPDAIVERRWKRDRALADSSCEEEEESFVTTVSKSIISIASLPRTGVKRMRVSYNETNEMKALCIGEIIESAHTRKTISIKVVLDKQTTKMSRLTDM